MRALAETLPAREDWLLERIMAAAAERGYARYASQSRTDWALAVRGLSLALAEAAKAGLEAVDFRPEESLTRDPVSRFAMEEARRHRERGLDMAMFLGLLAYFRQAYEALPELDEAGRHFVGRFFDRLATAVAVDWCAAGQATREGERRCEAAHAQNERAGLLALLRAMPVAVLATDAKGRVAHMNEAAVAWLGNGGADSPGHAGKAGESALGRDVTTLLPWLAPALPELLRPLEPGAPKPEPEARIAFMDTRLRVLRDANGAAEGLLITLHDASPLREDDGQQARIAAELRGELKQAAGLNRLAELLAGAGQELEELLTSVAAELPACLDLPAGAVALLRFDGRDYAGVEGAQPSADAPGAIEITLRVLGEERGLVRVAPGPAAQGAEREAAARRLLEAMARQLERALEVRLTLSLLSRSERQFREFFDNSADALFIHDETGRILDANKNAGIWLSASAGSLAGGNLLMSMAEGDRESTAGRFLNALRGDTELFQATLTRRDGFAIPVEFLCTAQDYQGRPALITSGRNITARLRAQAEIERRLEIEALVSGISARLINSSDPDMPSAIEEALDELCDFMGMQRGAVYLLDAKRQHLLNTYQRASQARSGQKPVIRRFSAGTAPWFFERIRAGERVFIRDVAHMPPAARKEKELLVSAAVQSMAAVPMTAKDKLLGVLAVASDKPQDAARMAGTRVLEQATLLLANAIDRLRTAQALRQSESLARGILDALPANICVLDKRGALAMVNRSWAATGPDSTPVGGRGLPLDLGGNYLEACRSLPDDPHARAACEGLEAMLAGKSKLLRLEYPVRVGGAERWFVLQATPLSRGRSGAVVSHRDITDRLAALARLKESEERFRIIVETAQEAVVNIDAATVITYANPRTESLFGYSQAELVGAPLSLILDPDDKPVLAQKLKRRRQGLSDQYELRFRHKNGHRVWTLLNASPLKNPDGSFAGSVGMITDMTDRVRAEARLRRNEARYRSLVESMHEGLVMTKRGGSVTYVNERFCAMLGRKRGDLLNHPLADFADPDSRPHLAALFAAGQAEGSQEILWEHASGRHIYSLVSPSAYQDEEGRVAGHFAVITDTTDRKGLESQLLQSQKLEAIGQLAAGIAHEINTPSQYVGNNVQFIKGAFEDLLAVIGEVRSLIDRAKSACPGMQDIETLEKLMAERDVDYLSEEVPGAIAQTLEGVERISVIVRSVKQFAHPGAAVMAPADLNESMKSTATVSRNEWKYVAELDLDLDPALPLVVCMIGEINQVVLNLIINAAHAIADAKKADPAREGRITLSTRLAPPWAEIRVRDSGTGIPAAVQARIFDPFFTTKEVGRGTGQGLTISRSIVMEKHKGQLFFETAEGVGTTFVVRLPVEHTQKEQEA